MPYINDSKLILLKQNKLSQSNVKQQGNPQQHIRQKIDHKYNREQLESKHFFQIRTRITAHV